MRARGGAAADPIGAARAAARAVARLDPTGRHRRRRPPDVGDEDTTGAEEADEGGDDAGRAGRDDLEELLHVVAGREGRREELFRRKDREADALMDNGVRINSYTFAEGRGRAERRRWRRRQRRARGHVVSRGTVCSGEKRMHRA